MPFVPQHPKLRFALPVPDRKRGLWRGCTWAVNPRHTYGSRTDSTVSGFDYVHRQRGIIRFAALDSGMMRHDSVLSWAFQSGAAFNRVLEWNDPLNYMRLDASPNVTIAVMMRFIGAVPGADRVIMSKRFDNAATSPGISINLTAAGPFSLSWSNGAANQVLTTVSGADSQFTRLIVGRRTNTQADIWLNGVMENSVAGPIAVANESTRSLKLFGDNTSTPLNAQVGFAALWNRALTQQEIALLHTDPWVMWKTPRAPGGLSHASGLPAFCRCCPGWLPSFNGMG
jgi:hypothetical protein